MKSIHAISTILAIWRIEPSGPAPNHVLHPVRPGAYRAKGAHDAGPNPPSGSARSPQSRAGIPTLLAAALLQGGSSANRNRD